MQNLASVQCAAAVLALMTCAVRANTPQYLYGASAPSTGPVTVTATTGTDRRHGASRGNLARDGEAAAMKFV